MRSKKTQETALLELLVSGRLVTTLLALLELGIGRLGARIYDLRQAGYQIQTDMVVVKTMNHGTARVAEYRIDREARNDR